jgi:serine/threonine-protein kinase
MAHAAAGTLKYMAPAQLCGQDGQPASDVWALGVIAYEMLTGSHPFSGMAVSDIVAKRVDVWPVIAPPVTDVPERSVSVFRHVLALEPERRPETPGQLLAALEQALATSPPDRSFVDD